MSDEIAYIGRNANARTTEAVEDFLEEVSRVHAGAPASNLLTGSRGRTRLACASSIHITARPGPFFALGRQLLVAQY
jgi:hypothetical protein